MYKMQCIDCDIHLRTSSLVMAILCCGINDFVMVNVCIRCCINNMSYIRSSGGDLNKLYVMMM